MIKRSIQNLNLFEIYDEITSKDCYGCDQEWYRTKWQRLSGCGPTVATTILYYLRRSRPASGPDNSPLNRSGCLSLMEEVWQYVTPKLSGIPTTKMFYDDVLAYAKAKALNLKLDVIDIPGNRSLRPEFRRLLMFLADALRSDAPIAFLNLNNGDEKQLDSWHWVTIISLEYAEDESTAFTEILDEGIIKKINLAQWFQTTTLGGGFVSISQPQ